MVSMVITMLSESIKCKNWEFCVFVCVLICVSVIKQLTWGKVDHMSEIKKEKEKYKERNQCVGAI